MPSGEYERGGRVKWTDIEVSLLADAFIEKRRKDFKSNLGTIWDEVFKEHPEIEFPKTFKNNSAWTNVPLPLKVRIKEKWDALMNPPPPPEPQEPPPPILLRVETERPVNIAEVLAKVDATLLVAQLEQRRIEREERMVKLLETMVARLGAVAEPKAAPAPARAALPLNAPEKRPKRVAIIGPLHAQVTEIEQKVKAEELFVEPRFIDKEEYGGTIPPSCDYVIITKNTRHAWYEAAKKEFGNGNVYFIDGPIAAVVQKLRDIASLK